MGSLHLIGGEKGGVGKSFTARLLAQYLIDRGQSFLGFDTDKSHGTFSRFYRDFTQALSVDAYESLDAIVAEAERNPESNIIVDLAAQTADSLNQWADDSDLFALMEELGYRVYLWHVMDDGADSMHLLTKLMQRFPQKDVQLVIVQNQGRGRNFENFQNSRAYQQAAERKAQFIMLPELQPAAAQKIDFHDSSFWAAANNRDALSVAERQRVRVWLRNTFAQLDNVLASARSGSEPRESSPAHPAPEGDDGAEPHAGSTPQRFDAKIIGGQFT